MKVDRRIAIVATCVMAASLSQCKSSATAPYDARTYSVTATPVTVPAVPTAPIAISTNDPNSHVTVTLPVAALQAIVAAAGGAATVSMTDVAPPDFGTLPNGEGASISSQPLTVLLFTVTKSSSAASSVVPAGRASTIAAQTGGAGVAVSFSIQLSAGTSCSNAPALYEVLTSSNLLSLIDATDFTLNIGPPLTITGSTTKLVFNQLSTLMAFECPTAQISGGSGGSN